MITECKKILINNGLKTIIRMTRDGITSFVPINEANQDYQKILEWVADGNTLEEADEIDVWIDIREDRDNLLAESDWTQGADSPLSASKKTEWATYRQALRDIPTEQSDETEASDITWPTKPTDE